MFFDGGWGTVDDNGYGEFYLPQFPVQRSSVSGALSFELAYLASRDSSGDTFTAYTEGDDYIVDYDKGIVRLIGWRFSPGQKNYRISCTAGYTSIPDDLEQLCIELCRMLYENRKNLQSEQIGTYRRTWDTQKQDPFVSDILAQYTRLSASFGL